MMRQAGAVMNAVSHDCSNRKEQLRRDARTRGGESNFVPGSPSDACDKMLSDYESARVGENLHLEGVEQFADEVTVFQPKKVLVLAKLTRLEFERRANGGLNDEELEIELRRRGSDYSMLKIKHDTHNSYLNIVKQQLEENGIEYRVVQRWDYSEETVAWADAILTAGGDGTFLLGASLVKDHNKPVIGINTDPTGSEGYMCLIKKLPESHFKASFRRLLEGKFHWLWRQRIRILLKGNGASQDPVELHDLHLIYPEYRWAEHVLEDRRLRTSSLLQLASRSTWRYKDHSTSSQHRKASSSASSENEATAVDDGHAANADHLAQLGSEQRVLPFLALNEVFVGESLSSRVSYYELGIDGEPAIKQKSSGLTLCTGTGSTSWYFNINKLTDQCVKDLLRLVNEEVDVSLPEVDKSTVSRICKRFNDKLVFSPSAPKMAYTVRDPVYNATFAPSPPRGFVERISVKSRCFDAHLVIDGGLSYVFNHGCEAEMSIHPEDALRTVVFR